MRVSQRPGRLTRAAIIAALVFVVSTAAACLRNVRNDIDSTNSELSGPYSVRATTDGKTFTADVCVENFARADVVAAQIIDQRLSHGHDAIVVNLHAMDAASAERVTWTPGGGSQTTRLPDEQGACR